VVCSEGLQKHVDYTSHTHNISDSSENTGVFCFVIVVLSCVWYVLLVDWQCFANILCYCEFEIAHTLVRFVLVFRCGWVGVVSALQAEAPLVCSCGVWGPFLWHHQKGPFLSTSKTSGTWLWAREVRPLKTSRQNAPGHAGSGVSPFYCVFSRSLRYGRVIFVTAGAKIIALY